MSSYDGHDDYDREFEQPTARTAALGVFGRLFDVVIAGLMGLVAGRWALLAMGPQRDWGGLAALIYGMGAAVLAAVVTFVVLLMTRNAELPLRLGVRYAFVAVFLVVFGLATAQSGG